LNGTFPKFKKLKFMNNRKNIFFVLLAVIVGLVAGYFVFGFKVTDAPAAAHAHTEAAATAEEQIWTCAMHPQIRQNEPGKCPICGMDLVPRTSSSSSDNPLVMEMTNAAVKLSNIQTVAASPAGKDGSIKTISLTGKIQPDERLVASQVTHVPGRIEQLFVTFTGETIHEGQKLATIYSPELVSAQRELIEAGHWKDSRPQLLEAARNKLRYWKITEAAIDAIEKSGELEPNITVFADKSGIVLKRRVAVGDYLQEGGVLFDIANLDRLWVLFDAYEEDLAEVRLGDEVEYTVASLPNRIFKARITFIDPVVNPQTRVALLRAEVTNVGDLLKPDMFVRGTIKAKTEVNAGTLIVPKTAVLWTGPRSVVYVEVPDANVPSFEFREVEVGDAVGSNYLIKSGLEPGERVVKNGVFVIDAAAQLNNMASMMNRNVRQSGVAPTIPDYSADTPDAFLKQLGQALQAYLRLKDAFVETDASKAAQAGKAIVAALGEVDMSLVDGDAHVYWMEKLKVLKEHGEGITTTDDVEIQRRQFSFLTNALVEALTAFGTKDTIYLQHCPMAFDSEGADWLSVDEAVKNPYFGEKMLTCGIIKETFPLERKPAPPAAKAPRLHNH
jgi:membrane fusion protein, copper/silver efflux system